MSDRTLDEILTFWWPLVLRRVMAGSTDDWLKGFVRSVARHSKRAGWRPTAKQEAIMRKLVAEVGTPEDGELDLIERG